MEVSPSLVKFPHSYRSGEEAVQTLSSRPVARLYLISYPLPANIAELEISISSKASCNTSADVPTKSRSWFKATIKRGSGPWNNEPLDWSDEVREIPGDFRDDVRARGWDFVSNTEVDQPGVATFDVMEAHYGDSSSGFRSCVWAHSS